MNGFPCIARSSISTLIIFFVIVPITSTWAINNGGKLEELRERSKRILATLDGLDSRLEQMRSANSEQSTPVNEVGPRDQEVIWEDYESIPLPGDSEDKETPQTVEEHTESGTIEWETYSENEVESPQENWTEQDTEFEFVIEKYEEENPEISDDPDSFNSSDSTYRVVRSDYYVIFNYGILLGSNIDFSTSSLGGISGEIETKAGNGMSLEFGFSFGMLELGILAGFTNQEFKNVSGEISNYYLALRPNLTFELSDNIDFRAGTSLGFSSRHNNFETIGQVDEINLFNDYLKSIDQFTTLGLNPSDYPILDNPIFQEEKLCFLWDFHTTLQWALWDSGGLLFGYRLAIVTGTGNFDAHIANSFEFGGRWGF